MKIKLVVIFVLFLYSKIFLQDIYYKVEYGKGSATASDVYLQMKLDNFLVEIEAKRLKSTIRDMDMEISTNIDGYDYYNDIRGHYFDNNFWELRDSPISDWK